MVAKILRRRFVAGVTRMLPAARLLPFGDCADGSFGTYASSTAAAIASDAPTHNRLESTVTSSARTENFAAKLATIDTIGRASSTPSTAPAPQRTRLSAS